MGRGPEVKPGASISVFWELDRKWYNGEVVAYDAASGICKVLYSDGESDENLDLKTEKYKILWAGKLRERMGKVGRVGVSAKNQPTDIVKTLIDIEDRLPPGGVHCNEDEWWSAWHSRVTDAGKSGNFAELGKAAVEIAFQMKDNISTYWWKSQRLTWQKQVESSTTGSALAPCLTDLKTKAVDWPVARDLFPPQSPDNDPEKKIPEDSRRGAVKMDLSGVNAKGISTRRGTRLQLMMEKEKRGNDADKKVDEDSGTKKFSSGSAPRRSRRKRIDDDEDEELARVDASGSLTPDVTVTPTDSRPSTLKRKKLRRKGDGGLLSDPNADKSEKAPSDLETEDEKLARVDAPGSSTPEVTLTPTDSRPSTLKRKKLRRKGDGGLLSDPNADKSEKAPSETEDEELARVDAPGSSTPDVPLTPTDNRPSILKRRKGDGGFLSDPNVDESEKAPSESDIDKSEKAPIETDIPEGQSSVDETEMKKYSRKRHSIQASKQEKGIEDGQETAMDRKTQIGYSRLRRSRRCLEPDRTEASKQEKGIEDGQESAMDRKTQIGYSRLRRYGRYGQESAMDRKTQIGYSRLRRSRRCLEPDRNESGQTSETAGPGKKIGCIPAEPLLEAKNSIISESDEIIELKDTTVFVSSPCRRSRRSAGLKSESGNAESSKVSREEACGSMQLEQASNVQVQRRGRAKAANKPAKEVDGDEESTGDEKNKSNGDEKDESNGDEKDESSGGEKVKNNKSGRRTFRKRRSSQSSDSNYEATSSSSSQEESEEEYNVKDDAEDPEVVEAENSWGERLPTDDSDMEGDAPVQMEITEPELDPVAASLQPQVWITVEETCAICNFAGAEELMLLCDESGCTCAIHTFCLTPPEHAIPEGDWCCPHCTRLKASSLDAKRLPKTCSIVTYPQKTVSSILGKRKVPTQEEGKTRDQYLVKWGSLSHEHDTWIPEDWLLYTNKRMVASFKAKYLNLPPEVNDVDERRPEWLQIDRIISCRKQGSKALKLSQLSRLLQSRQEEQIAVEFLVKWQALEHQSATWEKERDTAEFQHAINSYTKRHESGEESGPRQEKRKLVADINLPPEYLTGSVMYEFQIFGLKWLLDNYEKGRSVILADEMGLGKTVQALAFISCIRYENLSSKPVLVVAPKSTLAGWMKEFRKWIPSLNVVLYQGGQQNRAVIREHEFYTASRKPLFEVLLTNYELAAGDHTLLNRFHWAALVVDEGHRIKNVTAKLGVHLKQMKTHFRLLLTGTPVQNTLTELFALLHFLDAKEFPNPENSARQFTEVDAQGNNAQSDGTVIKEQVSKLHELLEPRMLRRLKTVVMQDSIPLKIVLVIPCALTSFQRHLYIAILKKQYHVLNKDVKSGYKRNLQNVLVDLKMACNHPYLFPEKEVRGEDEYKRLVAASGKLELLDKLLPALKRQGHRVLLFSQMTTMLNILEDVMIAHKFEYSRIDGTYNAAAREKSIDEFNAPDSKKFIFLISTRAGGLGINLPSADTVIINDPDFNPFVDLQAQARAHRIGQNKPVVVYQLITKCSVEEKILQRSRKKLAMENLVTKKDSNETAADISTLLLHGAQKILDDHSIEDTSVTWTDESIEKLLDRENLVSTGNADEPAAQGYLGAVQGAGFAVSEQEGQNSKASIGSEWKDLLHHMVEQDQKEELGQLGRGKRLRKQVAYGGDGHGEGQEEEEYNPSSNEDSSSSDSDSSLDSDGMVKGRGKKAGSRVFGSWPHGTSPGMPGTPSPGIPGAPSSSHAGYPYPGMRGASSSSHTAGTPNHVVPGGGTMLASGFGSAQLYAMQSAIHRSQQVMGSSPVSMGRTLPSQAATSFGMMGPTLLSQAAESLGMMGSSAVSMGRTVPSQPATLFNRTNTMLPPTSAAAKAREMAVAVAKAREMGASRPHPGSVSRASSLPRLLPKPSNGGAPALPRAYAPIQRTMQGLLSQFTDLSGGGLPRQTTTAPNNSAQFVQPTGLPPGAGLNSSAQFVQPTALPPGAGLNSSAQFVQPTALPPGAGLNSSAQFAQVHGVYPYSSNPSTYATPSAYSTPLYAAAHAPSYNNVIPSQQMPLHFLFRDGVGNLQQAPQGWRMADLEQMRMTDVGQMRMAAAGQMSAPAVSGMGWPQEGGSYMPLPGSGGGGGHLRTTAPSAFQFAHSSVQSGNSVAAAAAAALQQQQQTRPKKAGKRVSKSSKMPSAAPAASWVAGYCTLSSTALSSQVNPQQLMSSSPYVSPVSVMSGGLPYAPSVPMMSGGVLHVPAGPMMAGGVLHVPAGPVMSGAPHVPLNPMMSAVYGSQPCPQFEFLDPTALQVPPMPKDMAPPTGGVHEALAGRASAAMNSFPSSPAAPKFTSRVDSLRPLSPLDRNGSSFLVSPAETASMTLPDVGAVGAVPTLPTPQTLQSPALGRGLGVPTGEQSVDVVDGMLLGGGFTGQCPPVLPTLGDRFLNGGGSDDQSVHQLEGMGIASGPKQLPPQMRKPLWVPKGDAGLLMGHLQDQGGLPSVFVKVEDGSS